MDFIHGTSIILGTCSNLSESGLRGTFDGYVAPGWEGLLTLYHGDQRIEVNARVDSLHKSEARLRFTLASDDEREAVADLLKIFAVPPPR
jgi:hypothetical protein